MIEEEPKDMTRFVRISLIVCVVGLLSTALIPVALAERPVAASGTLCWMAPSDSFEVTKAADGNVFISATEVDEYTGTFRGTGNGVFVLVVHPEGFATGRGQEFVTGTVMGKSGTWEIRWTGNTRNDLGNWWFEWIIVGGTGDLANLRGQGVGSGPGPAGLDQWGCADYSAVVTFAPG